ncbi:conserved hypothetical protein [Thermosinus carboxydivorans Nor1]|uniref:DUF4446 domain-containing protein n=1 Tax=Thermosinus carboxydivorans Nor1 TaxID=401526 RepID=A1HSN0_9FIRM|nr:DUF4446 family protein [Thermosinus carboxydivorans]EAX46999.1 conserved hypothetical protein [Thermosinus carboxydivorans Nor1]
MDLAFLSGLVMTNLHYILLAITVIILIALIFFININIKLSRLNRRYQKLMQGMEGANIERLLLAHIDEVRETVEKVNTLAAQCRHLDAVTKTCIQRVGIVRFNAFNDTGSDLSFAIALLDAQDNGVVLSSIFGRDDSRVYAKPIVNGQSSYFLTNEEKEALDKARTVRVKE